MIIIRISRLFLKLVHELASGLIQPAGVVFQSVFPQWVKHLSTTQPWLHLFLEFDHKKISYKWFLHIIWNQLQSSNQLQFNWNPTAIKLQSNCNLTAIQLQTNCNSTAVQLQSNCYQLQHNCNELQSTAINCNQLQSSFMSSICIPISE